jgi:hypothetical protein
LRRALEDIRVVAIQASLRFNDAYAARWHRDLVVVSLPGTSVCPVSNQVGPLEMVQHFGHEGTLFRHGSRVRTSNLFNGAPKNARIVELLGSQTMCANSGRCLF